MASITTHGGKWRAHIYVDGRRESRVFRTRREANAWASAREQELRDEAGKAPAERVTLHGLIKRYRDEVTPSKRGAAKESIRLAAMISKDKSGKDRLPDILLSEVTPETIRKYRDDRLAVVKPNSVLRELGSLSAVFEHAIIEWQLIESNPVRRIRKPPRAPHRTVTISLPDIRRMLQAFGYSPRCRVNTVAGAVGLCFLAALRTGMRAGELCGLTWDRVWPDHCHVSGKTPAADRDVPLTPKTLRLLEKIRGFDPLMVFGLRAASLDAMFRKYRERAGLSGFTFHDSRHTAATWMVKYSQLNVLELCKIMGWTDPKMVMIYFNPDPAELVRRLSGRR